MHNQWQSPPPKNQQPPLQPPPQQQQPPPQTTSTITGSSNKFQIQKPQKKKKKKKKNSKSSTKLQPNRSINEKTQPTIGGEIDKSKSNKISNPNRAEIQKQKNILFFLVQSKQQNPDSVSSKRQI